MDMPNRETILSFIHSEEVANFLIWIGEQTMSPYGAPDSCYLDVTKATHTGY